MKLALVSSRLTSDSDPKNRVECSVGRFPPEVLAVSFVTSCTQSKLQLVFALDTSAGDIPSWLGGSRSGLGVSKFLLLKREPFKAADRSKQKMEPGREPSRVSVATLSQVPHLWRPARPFKKNAHT